MFLDKPMSQDSLPGAALLPESLVKSGEACSVTPGRCYLHLWGEVRDAADHLTMGRTAGTAKINLSGQNVKHGTGKKP